MNSNTPYESPASDIIDPAMQEFDDTQIFSTSQRIGRLRWLAYSMLANFVLFAIIGILAAVLVPMIATSQSSGGIGVTAIISIILVYLIPFIVGIILARRRLHDLGQSGWLGLLFLVPLVNLIFGLYLLFAPGMKEANQYGLRPKPNTVVTWVGGLLAPFIFIGLLAATAIPAYQDYIERAKAAQGE